MKKKQIKEPTSGYICSPCAKARGAVWPEGHVATSHGSVCEFCGKEAGLCSVGDWDWPKGSKQPKHSAGRD